MLRPRKRTKAPQRKLLYSARSLLKQILLITDFSKFDRPGLDLARQKAKEETEVKRFGSEKLDVLPPKGQHRVV
jgi:hypothetical protein